MLLYVIVKLYGIVLHIIVKYSFHALKLPKVTSGMISSVDTVRH